MSLSPESLAILRARLLKLLRVLEDAAANGATDPQALYSAITLHKSALSDWRSQHYPCEYSGVIHDWICSPLCGIELRIGLNAGLGYRLSNGDPADSAYFLEECGPVIAKIRVLLVDIGDVDSRVLAERTILPPVFAAENEWYTDEHRETARILARGAATVNAVAKGLGVGRDKARELLDKLASEGYVERDDDRSPYRLTPKASALPGVKSA